jgi:AraC-like DNA-binding protein/quercetin dioxygenase-like cupin family protein
MDRRGRIPVGTAVELVGSRRREQVCTGTLHGDLPDPRFRFNLLFVQHDAPFPLHGHEYSELVVVLDGRAVHRTTLGTHPIEAGDVFVVNGDVRHAFDAPAELRLANVQYDPRQFLSGHADLERLPGFHALFDLEPRSGRPPRLRLAPAQLAHVVALLRGLEEELRGRVDGRETVLRSTFLLLVAFLSRLYGDVRPAEPGPVARFAPVLAHARRHFREPLDIPDLARLAHLSPSQFQRSFKREFGLTPVRFLARLRVEEACALLRNPRLKLADVARDCGFGSPSFFSTQFKRFTGMSPREFRRRPEALRALP